MGSTDMRAAVARGKQALAVEFVPRPEPGAGEVRVRIEACGLCGTDLHLFAGGFAPGHTPGHEIAGRVDALGAGVRELSLGDPVAVEPLLSCGACVPCRTGRESICPQLRLLGVHVAGGFAEYVVVPARRLFPVPRDLDVRLAALAEPVAVVVHGLRRGGLASGARVLVLGAGAIGLLTVLAARAAGASEVLLTARHAHQAELGRSLGATRVLAESEANLQGLMALGKRAPADLVVETIGGHADALRGAAWALAPGGTISVLGVFTAPITLDGYPLLLKEGTLAWSNCYARERGRADFSDAIHLIDGERERLGPLLTHTVALDQIADAFSIASDKKAGAVKVTVIPSTRS
jgi:threonine dehydrogenase-like Zn-dependent dehydrogenase